MTENNQDRDGLVKAHVSRALNDGYELIYNRLDALQRRGFHHDEVIRVLVDLGEASILDGYAEWDQIELPDALDPEETTDDVVPDPYDAPSYDGLQLSAPKMVEFIGGSLLELLVQEFPLSYVEQTGGNTATLVIRKGATDTAITAGPGAFNWEDTYRSTFNAGDFYFGPDSIGLGDAEPYEGPGWSMDPAWSLDQLAEKIKAAYADFNPEGAGK